MGMPPASRMASLLALLSAARFCSVPTAMTAVVFSGLASTCAHAASSEICVPAACKQNFCLPQVMMFWQDSRLHSHDNAKGPPSAQ